MLYHFSIDMPRDGALDGFVATVLGAGWMGVDLFFVLSGFLITGILLDSRGGVGYFRNFYARRILRIWPLFYAFLLFGLVVYPKLPFQPYPIVQLDGGDQFWYFSFLGNLRIVQVHAFRNPLADITWTVAIEEQFYLVWPLIVAFVPRRWLTLVCFGALLTSLSVRTALYLTDPYYLWSAAMLTPSRIDGISIGALIAIALRDDAWKHLLARIGRTAIVVIFPIVIWLLYVPVFKVGLIDVNLYIPLTIWFGAALIMAVFSQPDSLVGRVLCSRVLRGFGKYSFALYLLHQSVGWIVLALLRPAGISVLGSHLPAMLVYWSISLALCYVVGWVSWHVYEQRFLDLKRYFVTRQGRHERLVTVPVPVST